MIIGVCQPFPLMALSDEPPTIKQLSPTPRWKTSNILARFGDGLWKPPPSPFNNSLHVPEQHRNSWPHSWTSNSFSVTPSSPVWHAPTHFKAALQLMISTLTSILIPMSSLTPFQALSGMPLDVLKQLTSTPSGMLPWLCSLTPDARTKLADVPKSSLQVGWQGSVLCQSVFVLCCLLGDISDFALGTLKHSL